MKKEYINDEKHGYEFDLSKYGSEIDRDDVEKMLAFINDGKQLYFNCQGDGYSDDEYPKITVRRLETDEEFEVRRQKSLSDAERWLEARRKQYEELKKEFEG